MLYIETAQQLKDNLHLISGSSRLGLDTETTGLDPLLSKIRLIQISSGVETLVIDVFKVGKDAVSSTLRPILESKDILKVLHNAKFDLKFIKHHLAIDVERIVDTMMASILLQGGITPTEWSDEKQKKVKIKGFHGLGQVSERYLGIKVDKEEQLSDWSGSLTKKQIEYAAKDAEVMLPLCDALIVKLRENKLTRCAKLEFEAVLPTAWLELCGFYLDFDQWLKVAEANRDKSYEVEEEICKELSAVIEQGSLFSEASINLNSPVQVQKYFKAYGIPMPDSTREFFLTPLQDKYPLIKKFIEYKGLSKAYSAFGPNYEKFINPVSGRIHADFMQGGTGTGRYATSGPNLAQIPADHDHRNCFKAEKGNKLIVSDFSQEELRLLAEFSGDKAFRQAFVDGDDFHKATAAQIFNISLDKVSKSDRDLAKRMNFLLTYGGGAERFALSAGIPVIEAERIMQTYFRTFKSVDKYLKYQQFQVVQSRKARSVSGRLGKYDFDFNDWKSKSHAQREAANFPMQASGADILKRAIRIFYDVAKPYQPHVKLVNLIHDEIIVESPADLVEEMTEKLESAMKQSWYESIHNVDIKVDTTIMDYWQKG